jgi:hypothetical protein
VRGAVLRGVGFGARSGAARYRIIRVHFSLSLDKNREQTSCSVSCCVWAERLGADRIQKLQITRKFVNEKIVSQTIMYNVKSLYYYYYYYYYYYESNDIINTSKLIRDTTFSLSRKEEKEGLELSLTILLFMIGQEQIKFHR